MQSNEQALKNTKRRLILIFVGLVLSTVFLLEGIFLAVRNEHFERTTVDRFRIESDRFMNLSQSGRGMMGGRMPARARMDYLFVRPDGTVETPSQNAAETEVPPSEFLGFLPENEVIRRGDFLLRRGVSGTGGAMVLFRQSPSLWADSPTDLLLLFIVNLVCTLPILWIGSVFIGRVLRPVEENFRAMRDFTKNAGHELKTPLAVLSGNLQLLAKLYPEECDLAESNIRSIKRMDRTVSSLLELSDTASVKSEKKDSRSDEVLSELLSSWREQAEKQKITLDVSIAADSEIPVNRGHFELVLENLFSNALRYTPEKGKITIRLDKEAFSIEDTGIGIEKDDLPKLFDRFFRARPGDEDGGSGIGLSIVKAVADLSGWRIETESEIGKGSRFMIRFS